MNQIKWIFIAIAVMLKSVSSLYAQILFEYEEDTVDTTEYVAHMIELDNGHYLAAMRKIVANSNWGKVTELTREGKVVNSAIFQEDNFRINALTQTIFGILVFGTVGGEGKGHLAIILLDDSLNTINQDYYPLGNFRSSGAYVSMQQDFILVSGSVVEGDFGFRAYAAKVSFDGSIMEGNPYFATDLITNGIERKQDNSFLFFGWRNKLYTLNAQLQLLKAENTPFELLQEGSIKSVNDTTIVLVGKKYNPMEHTENIGIGILSQFAAEKKLYQVGLSGDTVDFPAFNQSITLDFKNQLYVGGNANNQIGDWLYGRKPSWFLLSKLDDQTFAPLWTRYFGGNAYCSMFGLLATRDGGCIMYGSKYTKYGKEDAAAYILGVNVSSISSIAAPYPQDSRSLVTFTPNPSNGYVNIITNVENLPLNINWYDLTGKLVVSHVIDKNSAYIDLALPNGVYFYKCLNSSGFNMGFGKIVISY